jgi:hypothetical protein
MSLSCSIWLISTLLVGCTQKSDLGNVGVEIDVVARKSLQTEHRKIASKENPARASLVRMLNWHRQHDSIILKLQNDIVELRSKRDDRPIGSLDLKLYQDTLFIGQFRYRVSIQKLNSYLDYIKSSKFFTDRYIKQLRFSALKNDSGLVEMNINDGIVPGFDFEWVTRSQEWQIFTGEPDTITWVERSISDSLVCLYPIFADSTWGTFKLTRSGKKWLIDK